MDDPELLERFARDGSQDAFRELTTRHTNLVFACASQRLRDEHAAQDVTQAVFVALALKAKSLRSGTPLAGWLYRATKFACAKHQRTEERRKEREMRANEERADSSPEEAKAIEEALPHLAPALDSLSSSDRETVLLRFYGNASHQDVATTLGISEEAAKKRGNRALEKLRRFFVGRGVVLSAGAVASVLAASASHAAPAGLAATAGEAALAGVGGALGTTGTAMLAKGVLKMMFMAKVQAVAVGAVAAVAAGTVAVTAVQQVQTGADKSDGGARDGAANVILRQKEIPISVRDAKGALYVAVPKHLLDGADQSMWETGHFTGMHDTFASVFRLTREEQEKFQILMEDTWRENDILEQAFTVLQEGQTVTVELKGTDGAELFAGLDQRLRTNFLAKVSQVLGPERSEVLAWFTASHRGVFPWPVSARPTAGTTMYRMKLTRIQQGAAAIQLELDAEGELRVDSGRALPSVDGKSKKFRVVETTASPFPTCWPALGERLGTSRESLTAGLRSNRENYWARFDEQANWNYAPFARFARTAYRNPGQSFTPPHIGAESLSGDWRGVYIPVRKTTRIQGLSWMAEPGAGPKAADGARWGVNPAWAQILRLPAGQDQVLAGVFMRAVAAMDAACAKGLAVTRRSDNEVECTISGSAFAGFSAILATQHQEAEAAMVSAEKAEIVAVFAGEQMPVKSQAAQLIWALYANNTNAVTKGTGIRIQRRQEGTDERFRLADLAPREVQCIGMVDTDRGGLPAFLQGLWNASAAPVESEATKAAKVKLVDVQRLLREEKLGESIAAFEALRDQAEGLPDGLRAEIVYWLGESYLRSGNTEKARAAFKDVTFRHALSQWAKYARGRLASMPEPAAK
jgi:RNA polymerase sigma factor (sigma-70 family)